MKSTALALAVVLALPLLAHGDEQRVYVRSIPDRVTFDTYSKQVASDRFTKFIIDVRNDDIYFFDVNVFKIHADFVLGVLLRQEWNADNIREFNKNYNRLKPRFILGYVTEHIKVKKFSFSFWEGDKIGAKDIVRVKKRLARAFYQKNIRFRPDSPAQEQVARQVRRLGVPVVTNDQLYKSSPYQAFNNGEAVGTLRVVPRGTPFENLIFERSDICVLLESYPDISPVAGLLATKFSTPLSHVNLRARSWGIPNAGLVDAYKRYSHLNGKVVFYEVKDTSHVLRLATPKEIREFKDKERVRKTVPIPNADLKTRSLPLLSAIRAKQSTTFGAKSANLGELARAKLHKVWVPKGFAVPFSYYAEHMRRHGLDKRVEKLLEDPRFESSSAWRKSELADLRKAIAAASMAPKTISTIYMRKSTTLRGGVFVRSSTNAEDLEGFNGAGLYDTVPNVKGKNALEAAIKKVWASLWNYRAVEERSLFGIDHRRVYAGVLIQRAVEASAAGVLITTNLYDSDEDDTFTINAKWGLGLRVVEGKSIPEQIVFDTSNNGTKIISRSDDKTILVFDDNGGIREVPNPNRGVILSERRARALAKAVMRFRPLFPARYPLDVEWLLEGDRVWIVQVRPYVSGQ